MRGLMYLTELIISVKYFFFDAANYSKNNGKIYFLQFQEGQQPQNFKIFVSWDHVTVRISD